MNMVLTIDFGSTNTKVAVIDTENCEVIANATAYTTIETDVRIGLNNAKKEIFSQCGLKDFDTQIACSSAAGGLKMISCGLVPDLTVKAAKMAASSAGAKVLKSYAYELSPVEIEEIKNLAPDIILLCGGTDGGNKEVIIHNAKMLSEINMPLYIIVAGNKSVSHTVKEILENANKTPVVAPNVLPEFGNLNIMPVKNTIRDLFIERIIDAKGLNEAQKVMSYDIVPTPLAVFDAAELLSKGTKEEEGLEDILLFDVGGATTDVYSMNSGDPKTAVVLKGLKEPYAKRTVEGDIGVRYSLPFLMENIDFENVELPEGLTFSELNEWVERCKKDCSLIPTTEKEKLADMFFAKNAVGISINRHAGTIEEVYAPMGKVYVQSGKSLEDIKFIIGSGGSVINSINPKYILESAIQNGSELNLLKPKSSKFMLDKRNIIASCGLLLKINPNAAIKIMKKYLVNL